MLEEKLDVINAVANIENWTQILNKRMDIFWQNGSLVFTADDIEKIYEFKKSITTNLNKFYTQIKVASNIAEQRLNKE